MNKFFMSLAIALIAAPLASAQIVSSTPNPLYQDSKNVVITYRPDDASSNKALADLPASTQLYAHVGVITTASKDDKDWKHAPTWKDNSDKYKLTYVGPNQYTLNIGDINTYFGITGNETVKKLVFVFRDATASKEGKTNTNSDITLDLGVVNGTVFSYTYSPNSLVQQVNSPVTFTITNRPGAELSIAVRDNSTMETTVIASKQNAEELTATYTFPKAGKYRVTFSGYDWVKNKATSESLTFTAVDGGKAEPYPGGTPVQGAKVNSDGSVTFCIAAPDISIMKIIGSWDNTWSEDLDSQMMNYYDAPDGNRYFWKTVTGLDLNKQHLYYYTTKSVSGDIRVADPYGELILDKNLDKYDGMKENWAQGQMELPEFPAACISNKLTVFDAHMHDFNWSSFKMPDVNSLFIYEMLFRDFTGTEGESKGDGTIRLAMEKIPYLVDLGVTAVELLPVMEFAGNKSWGYNTDYYFAPDKVYGSPTDLKEFIDECHKNGIAVILDIVFNQCQDNPRYQLYSSGSNPFINATSPHDYSVLNDWNQSFELNKQMWDDCVKFWLTKYNVDGFRFDLVKGLGDNESYGSTEAFNQSRVDNMTRIHKAMKSVKPNSIHINEFLGGLQEEKSYGADGQINWANYSGNGQSFVKGSGSCQLHYYAGAAKNGNDMQFNYITYSESHDEQRVAYSGFTSGVTGVKGNMSVVAKRVGQLLVSQILSPAPIMLWQFQEIVADENTKNGNDNNTGNKKVIWDNLNNPDYRAVYESLCAVGDLRRANPELFNKAGTYTYSSSMSSSSVNDARYMILRDGQKEVVAFLNPNVTTTKTVSVPVQYLSTSNSMLICASKDFTPSLTQNGSNLEVVVPANGYCVYSTKNIAGVEDAIADGDEFGAAQVYGLDGEIVIVGEYRSADVYNMQGLSMGRLDNLDRGIYIVRVDGTTHKVAVR